jgi:hypothetical protein
VSPRPDKGIVTKIATYVSSDYLSINTFAIYEELRLAANSRKVSRGRFLLFAIAPSHDVFAV